MSAVLRLVRRPFVRTDPRDLLIREHTLPARPKI